VSLRKEFWSICYFALNMIRDAKYKKVDNTTFNDTLS